MKFVDLLDPFVMQLIIVPVIVIGIGLLVSFFTKKVLVAPLITLLLNLLYETWYMKSYYPELEMSYTSWNIIFPVISLVISLAIVPVLKHEGKYH
ncbi:hypothetical protein [Bacillus ndiopicus]|uniref:hypothetical protein n=1 Tax=Bacillus ndiopicus TaxID=1347368 RepID=UPI0005A8DF1D|nr:hypothetical protein [Bacillus ndiopicus]